MRLYSKHAFLMIAVLSKKHERRNWWDNKRLMRDHHAYICFCIGRCNNIMIDPDSDVSLEKKSDRHRKLAGM